MGLRDGTEASRDQRTGSVLAELVLTPKDQPKTISVITFQSPWPLAKGSVFDIECRDGNTGDNAYVTVSNNLSLKKNSVGQVSNSFLLEEVFSSTGRFAAYGAPTDIKIKKSDIIDGYKIIEVTFSTLSQATQTEIPRTALIAAVLPPESDQVEMLVSSTTTNRWRKKNGVSEKIKDVVTSFRATSAPKSSLKIRVKDRKS